MYAMNRLAAGLLSCGMLLGAQLSAGEPTAVNYSHFCPPLRHVVEPAQMQANSTTPVPVTAPQHNANPSALVPQPPVILEVPCIEASRELEVDVNFAMEQVGTVVLRSGNTEMKLPVSEWSADRIRFRTPDYGVLNCHYVSVHIYRPDGYLVRQFSAQVVRSYSIRQVIRTTGTACLEFVEPSNP